MTGEGRELFEGFMDGLFSIVGGGDFGSPIHYIIPFEIKMWIEKSKGEFKGNYALEAHPTLIQPVASPVSPGVLAFFPSNNIAASWSPTNTNIRFLSQNMIFPQIMKKGDLEVTTSGNLLKIRFKDIPGKFMVHASVIAEDAGQKSRHSLPLFGSAFNVCDFGFFSREHPNTTSEIALAFSQKIIGYQKHFKDRARIAFPKGGTMDFVGRAIIVKTESFYSALVDGDTHYVEQVPEVEKARQLFLQNPELLEKIQAAARQEIRKGKAKGEKLVAPYYVAKLDKLEQEEGTRTTPAGTGRHKETMPSDGAGRPAASTTLPKPLEGLVYAIQQLVALGKDGHNSCLLVVDGCWINVVCKQKKKVLYIQVAGDKYIPKKFALKPEHIKKLEQMNIKREEGSIDIFSIQHSLDTMDTPKIARDVFKIFDEVLRVSKGAAAYIQYELVREPTPASEAVLATLAQFIPDRREKNKFYWRWGTS
nr:hypothetical protein [Candidatus Sigynarchaeum springense]MDO8119163.1 hypothetical protein [Candidatus Sigynarchaeota archaeon]